MLKLKLQYFRHLMWRADSLGKTLILWKIDWHAAVHGVKRVGQHWAAEQRQLEMYPWVKCFSGSSGATCAPENGQTGLNKGWRCKGVGEIAPLPLSAIRVKTWSVLTLADIHTWEGISSSLACLMDNSSVASEQEGYELRCSGERRTPAQTPPLTPLPGTELCAGNILSCGGDGKQWVKAWPP